MFFFFFRIMSERRSDMDSSWPSYSDSYRPPSPSTGDWGPQGPVFSNNAVNSGVSLYRGE